MKGHPINKHLIPLAITSSLALFTACQSLLPPVDVANPLGMDNVEVDATLETEAAASSVRGLAVGANLVSKGSFNDFDAPDNPVPISLEFTPQVKFGRFKSCSVSKDSFTLTFSKFSVSVKDGVGTPAERSFQTAEVGPVNVLFTKTTDGKHEPNFKDFQGLFVALNWQAILPIVKLSGANTPNNGLLAFRLSSSDDALKGCVLALTFGPGSGKLKF